jgi:hypothetical protein
VVNCRYDVEPSSSKPELPEHHLVLQDFVLEKPRTGEANVCRRRYDRTGSFGSKQTMTSACRGTSAAALLLLCSVVSPSPACCDAMAC